MSSNIIERPFILENVLFSGMCSISLEIKTKHEKQKKKKKLVNKDISFIRKQNYVNV